MEKLEGQREEMMRKIRLVNLAARCAAPLLLLSVGCVQMVPPPQTPDMVAPALGDVPPLEEGLGRVVVDVVDGPTAVQHAVRHSFVIEVDKGTFASASSVSTERLCTSPCVVDMPLGTYSLAFATRGSRHRLEFDAVDVSGQPTVYRRALGSYEGGGAGLVLGILGVVFGGAALVVGTVLLPVGAGSDNDGMMLAGGINLAAGGLLTTLGIVAIVISPSLRQPGAAVQFPL